MTADDAIIHRRTAIAVIWLIAAGQLAAGMRSPPASANEEIAQRFVCERSYTNYAWGYQHAGIYVDREGSVRRFSIRSTSLPRPGGPDFSEAELAAKYGPEATVIAIVSREELVAMFRLIAAAAKGRYSRRVESGTRDFGAIASACYVFDAAADRYREVELDVRGDWEYRNLAPEAEKLAGWLAALDPRMPPASSRPGKPRRLGPFSNW